MKTNKVTGSRGIMYTCRVFHNFDFNEIEFQCTLFFVNHRKGGQYYESYDF